MSMNPASSKCRLFLGRFNQMTVEDDRGTNGIAVPVAPFIVVGQG